MRAHRCLLDSSTVAFLVAVAACWSVVAPAADSGLLVTFSHSGSDPMRDFVVSPRVALYVQAGDPPTPFLPSGDFSAVWEGFVAVDLRGNYRFQADLNGALKLEINGAAVLETSGPQGASERAVRLNKGTNSFKAIFTSPATGDAFVRLLWIPKDSFAQPIPPAAFTHPGGHPELDRADKLRRGRELFLEHLCINCHTAPAPSRTMPDVHSGGPSLENIGSRRNFDWMRRWILDPQALRPGATMPKLLKGPGAEADAAAIAAFLASQDEAATVPGVDLRLEDGRGGKALFEKLLCATCHLSPELEEAAPEKVSLKELRQKFVPETLPEYLQAPEAHYAWTRMPRFELTPEESRQLAAYLLAHAAPVEAGAFSPGLEEVQRGKHLIQTSGCLNCHDLDLENRFTAQPLSQLPAGSWTRGCAADRPPENAPDFSFSNAEREALRMFASADRKAVRRHSAVEFAERQIRSLNCRECHRQVETFLPLELLGGKLKPEWSEAFIAGKVTGKPRPWLHARMPAFPARARELARGMAMQHGYAPDTPGEPAVDTERARIGQQLVSATGGFSCVSCHAVEGSGGAEGVDAPGIHLAQSGARLQPDFFKRWLRQPALIDPQTKMPVYFDEEGRSPLSFILDGSAEMQVDAMWQYIRLGEKIPAHEESAP